MAHDHDHHHHHDANTYYLEQLFTIGVCAALAFVTCLWWWKAQQPGGQGLKLFIAERYHPLVLAGGLGLLALVAVRAAALWVSVDKTAAANGNGHAHEHAHDQHHHHDHAHEHQHPHEHTHEHAHGVTCAEGCGHSHAPAHDHGEPAAQTLTHHDHAHDHGHGHDHGHDHGWAPWRYVVLALPVALYFLNLPNEVFGGTKDLSNDLGGPAAAVTNKGFAAEVGFKQLEAAALTPQTREEYTGKTVRLVGKFVGEDARRFTLARLKINCCSADAIPFNAVVMVDPKVLAENSKLRQAAERLKPRNKWVQVTGQVQFLSRPSPNDPGKTEYVPAVIVQPKPDTPGQGLKDLIEVIPPPANPYVD